MMSHIMKLTVANAVLILLATTASTHASDNQEDKETLFLRSGSSENANKVIGGGIKKPSQDDDEDAINDRLDRRQKVLDFWTPERIRNAKPRHMTHDIIRTGPPNGWGNGRGDKKKGDRGHQRNLQNVVDAHWESGGEILRSAGRLLFVMDGVEYLCSATTVRDDTFSTPDRSVLITAAHCVYDDVAKAFATEFMFIPNQDGTTGRDSNRDCFDDPLGCWTPSFGVVDVEWASKEWSDNIPADYAYLIVDNRGSRDGFGITQALDKNVRGMRIDFGIFSFGDLTHALGYSGKDDPYFMYCVQELRQSLPNDEGYLLLDCGLQGGSSGGPWIKDMDGNGRGEIIAVNSYGPGGGAQRQYMGGPRLHSNSAECLYEMANTVPEEDASGRGIVVTWTGDCETSTYVSGDDFSP